MLYQISILLNVVALPLSIRHAYNNRKNRTAAELLVLLLGFHLVTQLVFPFVLNHPINFRLAAEMLEMALIVSYFYHLLKLPKYRIWADIAVISLILPFVIFASPMVPGMLSSTWSGRLSFSDDFLVSRGIMLRGVLVLSLFCLLLTRLYYDVKGQKFNLMPSMFVLVGILVYYVGVSGTMIFSSLLEGVEINMPLNFQNITAALQISFYSILSLGFLGQWHS